MILQCRSVENLQNKRNEVKSDFMSHKSLFLIVVIVLNSYEETISDLFIIYFSTAVFLQTLANAVVKVVIPTDRYLFSSLLNWPMEKKSVFERLSSCSKCRLLVHSDMSYFSRQPRSHEILIFVSKRMPNFSNTPVVV